MPLKKIPHQFIRRDVHRGWAERRDDGLLPGPGVAAVFDFDEHDFAAILAAAPGPAGAFHAVVGLVRQSDDFGIGLAAIGLDPALSRVFDGAKLRDASTPQGAFAKAAFEGRELVACAVEMHD